MSTIITHKNGMQKIHMRAPDCTTTIINTDMRQLVIHIHGDPKDKPFIVGTRFIDCIIIADNLRAFESCYFQSCDMRVAEMPIVNGCRSINTNFVEIQNV